MKQVFLLLASALSVCSCCTCPSISPVETGPSLSPREFAILGWGVAPGDPEVMREYSACGFNLALVEQEDIGLAHRFGLDCLVNHRLTEHELNMSKTAVMKHTEADVKDVDARMPVYGFFLCDEPGRKLFRGLSYWVNGFRNAAPDSMTLINLFPNYASSSQLGTISYRDYLTSFVNIVNPPLLCYDHYALMQDGTVKEDTYYGNLEAVRAVAQENDLPFWNVVLSQGCLRFASPTPANLRFQLYTTMAYGARGIVYWCYYGPSRMSYRLAPLDQFGFETPTWAMMREVNLQARHVGTDFARLRSVGVFHHPDVPPESSGLESSRYFKDLKGGRYLVGEFEDSVGRPWAMVVNKSLDMSVVVDALLRVPGHALFVNPFTAEVQPWSGENLWLAPGQGVLLSLAAD